MRPLLAIPVLLFLFSSCAFRPFSNSDADADAKLGLVQDEERGDTEEALSDIQEAQRMEQSKQLQRVITDPVVVEPQTQTN